MSIKHPVLKYYGSKFRLARWIISHFPAHTHYVEPFGGAGNVLLVKEPSRLETFNDLNDAIVNFFRVLRTRPDELIEQIKLTPWARSEFEYCLAEKEIVDPVEMARRLYFRLWMSYQSAYLSCKGNWRRHKNGKRAALADVSVENLKLASERLRVVQIECRDAFQLITEMDSPETLFYLDPPYVFKTRSQRKAYSHEMTDDDHRRFAEVLYDVKGFVVLSGYPSDLYAELFERRGWRRVDRRARVMGGGAKTECLWLSPRTAAQLEGLTESGNKINIG